MSFPMLVLKNLLRRPFRSLLTILGLSVALGAVVSLVGISSGFERSFLEVYSSRQVDLIVARKGVVNRQAGMLDESLIEKLRTVPGIAQLNYGMVQPIDMSEHGLVSVIVNGWADDSPLYQEINLMGEPPKAKNEIILGEVLARGLKKNIGDELTIMDEPGYKVVGIYTSVNVFENGSIIMRLEDVQRMVGFPGKVTGFTVKVAPVAGQDKAAAIAQVAEAIEQLDPEIAAEPVESFVSNTTEIRAAKAMSWLTSAVAVIIGAVGMLNTMLMSVFERTREIGILRAMGWRKGRVLSMVLSEAMILSLLASVVGTIAAIGLVRGLSNLPWTSGMIDSRIGGEVMLQALGIAAVVGVVGSLYPALHGANLPPTVALRHE